MTVHELSALQMKYVRLIATVVAERKLDRRAAVYAVATSGAEASLTNWENHGRSTHIARGGRLNGRQLNAAERARCRESIGLGDGAPSWGDNLDSMGLFAQRFTEGWGEPRQLMDPRFSTGKFLDGLVRVPGWQTRPAGDVLRAVQGFYSDIYSDWLSTAESVVPHISGTSTPTPGRDWFDMATKEELKSVVAEALDELAGKTVERLLGQPISERGGATFLQVLLDTQTTVQNNEQKDIRIEETVNKLGAK